MNDEVVYRPFRIVDEQPGTNGYGDDAAESLGARQDTALPRLAVQRASGLADRPVPPRTWLVPDLVPDAAVTMISGDGGVGKSLLALQLTVATSRGSDWAGTLPEPGPALYVSAEDDLDELHRRLHDIAGEGLSGLVELHILALAGMDAVLGAADGRGAIAATPLFRALVAEVARLRPRLVVVDNLADAFSGNENSRPEARQFIGMLRGMAIEHGLAVVLISHPSLTGLSSGTGTSGSTAWSNSVRSRLYLDRAKGADGDEPDPNLRILKVMEANYASSGTEVRLRWETGVLKLDGSGPGIFDRIAAEAKAERVFLQILRRFAQAGRDVSPHTGRSFAPAIFFKQPDVDGCSKKMLEGAMERLLATGKVRIEKHGPPSRAYSRLVASEP